MDKKKLSRIDLQKMKETGQTAVWITAYDYWTASGFVPGSKRLPMAACPLWATSG